MKKITLHLEARVDVGERVPTEFAIFLLPTKFLREAKVISENGCKTLNQIQIPIEVDDNHIRKGMQTK